MIKVMQPRVLTLGQHLEVLDPVVEGIVIPVVDIYAARDDPVALCPHCTGMPSPAGDDAHIVAVIVYFEAGRNPEMMFAPAFGIPNLTPRLGAERLAVSGFADLCNGLGIADLAPGMSIDAGLERMLSHTRILLPSGAGKIKC